MKTAQQLASATTLRLAGFTTSASMRAHGDSGELWVTRQGTDRLVIVNEQRELIARDLRDLQEMDPNDRNADEDHLATDPPVGHHITLSRRPAVLLAGQGDRLCAGT